MQIAASLCRHQTPKKNILLFSWNRKRERKREDRFAGAASWSPVRVGEHPPLGGGAGFPECPWIASGLGRADYIGFLSVLWTIVFCFSGLDFDVYRGSLPFLTSCAEISPESKERYFFSYFQGVEGTPRQMWFSRPAVQCQKAHFFTDVYLAFISLAFRCTESLLVMSSLGVQLTTTFATGRTKSTFFDISEVKDIIINEAVTMVRFRRAVLLILIPRTVQTRLLQATPPPQQQRSDFRFRI